MSKHIEKLRKLNDVINATIAESGIPVCGVAVVFEWDMAKIPASDANPKDLPAGVLTYPGEITLRNVLQVQKAIAGFTASLTEMAVNSVANQNKADEGEAEKTQ